MRRLLFYSTLVLNVHALVAQAPADSAARLTYYFVRPSQTALAQAMAGLPTLDGEFVAVYREEGDSIAEIIARVRDRSWRRNPEVWGRSPGDSVFFGRLQTYLWGDQRFRVLVLPAVCTGCEGDRRAIFLPFADTTGYVVGGRWPLPIASRWVPGALP